MPKRSRLAGTVALVLGLAFIGAALLLRPVSFEDEQQLVTSVESATCGWDFSSPERA